MQLSLEDSYNWFLNEFPIGNKGFAFPVFFLLVKIANGDVSPPTINQFFLSFKFSGTAIRRIYRELQEADFIEVKTVQNDGRVKRIHTTKKFLKFESDYYALIERLFDLKD
jgi:hypothetical protein